jgi:surface polysaccharide O-acyltransferase-like enzyme
MLGSPMAALRAANRSLDRRIAATPVRRDRPVDALRAFSIVVVVTWHWTLSITHRVDGKFVMPNPIEQVPLAWLATWVLQVMPVFFLVGGFANLAAWDRADAVAGSFLRTRLTRLLRPAGVFVVVWAAAEAVLRVAVRGHPGVVQYAQIVFTPLWYLAAYLGVVLLVPLTAAAHRRAPMPVVVLLGAAVVAVDTARFGIGLQIAGLEIAGAVNSVLVWVFVHQLGYLWRDGILDPPRRRWSLAAAGLTGLVVVSALDVYPRSMVATTSDDLSHMFPTTAGIAALAAFQLGLVLLLRPALGAWLQRRRVWKAVVAINAVAMTVFLWHMTALLAAFTLLEAAGLPIHSTPTTEWWAQRPVWLLSPAILLALLVAVFARAETSTVTDNRWSRRRVSPEPDRTARPEQPVASAWATARRTACEAAVAARRLLRRQPTPGREDAGKGDGGRASRATGGR